MEAVPNGSPYDTLKFTSSVGDEIYRILGVHTYDAIARRGNATTR